MTAFPDDFCFANSEKIIKEKVMSSEELDNVRKYIMEQHKKAINDTREYFTIDLSSYEPIVRATVMQELITKFPHIGYPSEIITSQINNVCKLIFSNDPNQAKISLEKRLIEKVEKINPNVKKYIIALTSNFRDSMTSYYWP